MRPEEWPQFVSDRMVISAPPRSVPGRGIDPKQAAACGNEVPCADDGGNHQQRRIRVHFVYFAYRQFTDGVTRTVYADGDRQYVIGCDGERVYDVWPIPPHEPVIIHADAAVGH